MYKHTIILSGTKKPMKRNAKFPKISLHIPLTQLPNRQYLANITIVQVLFSFVIKRIILSM